MDTKLVCLLVLSAMIAPQFGMKFAFFHEHDHDHGPRATIETQADGDYYDYDATDPPSTDDFIDWLIDLQILPDHCNPNPCLNNGVCETENGRFKCDCPRPYKGKTCQRVEKVCKKNTCGHGLCVLTSSPPFYECKCRDPYQPPDCRTVSVCKPSPCKNGGSCIPNGDKFQCACPDNFSGKFCQVVSEDCYRGNGESYRGLVSETDEGDDCLFWNSHFLLDRGTDPFTAYEDSDGLGPHNNCRNPDGDAKPWCFIRQGNKLRWDYCNIRKCSAEAATTHAPAVTTAPAVEPEHPGEFGTCGKPKPARVQQRLYGGMKAIPAAHPWQVSVQVRPVGSFRTYQHNCGGVLIKPCWVLTAGHCIDPRNAMQVVVGGANLARVEPTEQTLEVEKVILHEHYRQTPFAVYNDIALLKLKDDDGHCTRETQFVKTACLPDAAFPDGTECTISGWGATERSPYGSTQLLDAKVKLIAQQRCTSPDVYGSVLDDSMFCAGYLQGGVDSCQGDSGGPLVCVKDDIHYVYGLVSWGDGCAKKNKPGVYTRLTQFTSWIDGHIGGA